jgi:hypothetical protein
MLSSIIYIGIGRYRVADSFGCDALRARKQSLLLNLKATSEPPSPRRRRRNSAILFHSNLV